jgi:hypothetical protein
VAKVDASEFEARGDRALVRFAASCASATDVKSLDAPGPRTTHAAPKAITITRDAARVRALLGAAPLHRGTATDTSPTSCSGACATARAAPTLGRVDVANRSIPADGRRTLDARAGVAPHTKSLLTDPGVGTVASPA